MTNNTKKIVQIGNTLLQGGDNIDIDRAKDGRLIINAESGILSIDYTGSVKEYTLSKGTYKLECWGAEGGRRTSSAYGGKGGYSKGEITLAGDTNIYVYVGGYPGESNVSAGTDVFGAAGFNGGGKRHGYPGGGGASDIRIGQDSFYARAIVAGGGGSVGAANKKGGYGGGDLGQSITDNYGTGGNGASQTAAGAGSSSNTATNGSFGQGGQGFYASSGYAGAGGGGWYGGAGSYPDGSGDDDRGGGGGSGWVWKGVNAPGGWLLDSKYCLADSLILDGSQTFLSPNGDNETGHSGNGYVRITKLDEIKKGDLGYVDFNTVVTPGFYRISGDLPHQPVCAPPNAPTESYNWNVFVFSATNDHVVQIATAHASKYDIYVRLYGYRPEAPNQRGWEAWSKLYTTNNLPSAKDGITYDWLTGTSEPPVLSKQGDMYLNTATCDVYKKISSDEWAKQCNIKGATSTEIYNWLTGSSAPASNLGNQGDMYLDTSTCNIYKKTSLTAWTLQCNIKGATGATGSISSATGATITGNVLVTKTETSQQDSLLKVLSTETSASAGTWRGRAMFGTKDLTFLMGVYNGVAGLGAHGWSDAAAGTGASWADIWLNPDGANTVRIGKQSDKNGWTVGSEILKIDNSISKVTVNGRSVVSPSTLVVGFTNDCDYICTGSADQTVINAAISALPSAGGKIILREGTYNLTKDIVMNKANVALEGMGNSTILKRMAYVNYMICVSADYCKVSNCYIDGNRSVYSFAGGYGIRLDRSSYSVVMNNISNNNSDYGIYVYGGSNNIIADNICNNNSYLSGSIVVYTSSNNTVIGNNCSGNGYGILVYYADNNTITGNTCNSNNSNGIYIGTYASNNTITGNTCNSNNSNGIYIGNYASSSNTITSNTYNNNGDSGILLDASSNNTITGNTCNGNNYGVNIKNSSCSYNLISSNQVSNNTSGGISNLGTSTLIRANKNGATNIES